MLEEIYAKDNTTPAVATPCGPVVVIDRNLAFVLTQFQPTDANKQLVQKIRASLDLAPIGVGVDVGVGVGVGVWVCGWACGCVWVCVGVSCVCGGAQGQGLC